MRIRTIAKEYDGRWMIVSAIALAMLLFGTRAHAQIVSSNPLEYVALAEGNDLINGQIKHQIEDQQKTALLQNTIDSRVYSDTQMGEEVQQLSENSIWLCLHAESMHLII